MEELDAENTEKTSEELQPYISVCTDIRVPMKEAGPPLDALVARGCSMMCWIIKMTSPILHAAMWGEARH